ncbi:hypothetical protein HXX76_007013 [Chlamydomonas incerta]|uniref:FAD/NAD(P)-binding domain-containing protein n=1 Tax=Chlamydomonas incerta TaxID=51695 RepID=A0A835SZ31_CHLIN|nr:hypothetical protein HXX76_007013 [Chlamydomonas incerta]|eukprot:KAG2435818.1 hypothetical protein HXX76_007013 [Chlamydomonas incerta]
MQRTISRMQRLGLGSIFAGDWTGAARLVGLRTAGSQAPHGSRAVATQAAGSPAFGPGTSSGHHSPRVVVLGGGFGGLYAAVRLEQLMWPRGNKPQITLVDQSDRFVFKPLLYELINGAASADEVSPSFGQLLAPYPIRFVQAQVASVATAAPLADAPDPDVPDAAGAVTLADGTQLPYDFLVVALGGQPDSRGVPGVKEWAVPFAGYEDALRVKGTLDLLSDAGTGGCVVVVGAGYSGVELAATVAERLRARGGGGAGVAVKVLTPGSHILEGCPEGQREAASKALADLGVEVLTGARVLGLSPPLYAAGSDDEEELAAGTSAAALPTACVVSYSLAADAPPAAAGAAAGAVVRNVGADLVVWTAGTSPATREARAGFPFPVNQRGAIETEPTLRVSGSGNVFALGDTAVAAADPHHPAHTLPATAQVAFQQADYAAWNVWAAINGRPLLPFKYQHLGSMMALGQTNAAVALPIPVPSALAEAVRSSPLGPLLSAAGVRVGGAEPEAAASAAGAAAAAGKSSAVGDSGVTVEGPLAQLMRRGAYLYRQPTNEQRLNVAASWVRLGLEAAASLAGGSRR